MPQLRAFVVLADLKHFGRAADRLHITQPALTKRILALEAEVGGRLFTRDRTKTRLTPMGNALLDQAMQITADADAWSVRARNIVHGTEGSLDVGFGLSTIEIAPRLIARFRNIYPKVIVSLNDFSSVEQVDRLKAGRLDIGFIRLPLRDPSIESRALTTDGLAFAVPPGWTESHHADDFDALNALGFVLLRRERGPGLRAQIDEWCKGSNLLPRVTQIADDIQTLLALVAAGVGASLVPQRAARLMGTAVELIPLEGEGAEWQLGAAWIDEPTNPAVANFVRLLTT